MNDIVIRKAKKGDETGIARMIKEAIKKKAWPYTGMVKYTKQKFHSLKKLLASKSKTVIIFVAEDRVNKRIAGNSNYSFQKSGRLRHRVDIGWMVHPDYMRKGIGTRLLNAVLEDAKKKGYKRAEAEVAVENKASLKLAKKYCFKIEGRKRKALLLDDERMVDTYVFGKLL